MTKENDGLFLLEVLVDKIVFLKSPCFSDKDFRTCVTISCPSVEPLEICDDDPGTCVAKSGGPFVKRFNSGKSCLFSLKEKDIVNAMAKFPVYVSVHKSLPCGCLPTKIILGEATIDMTKEFVQARNKYIEDPNSVSYQALKDSFRILGQDGLETGEIVMFLRISCFGKLIVTKFQGAGGQVTLGAGGQGGPHDRSCNPPREFQTTDEPCVCGVGHGSKAQGGGATPCKAGGRSGGSGLCPSAQDPYNSMPCLEPDDPCYCSGPRAQKKPPMTCRNTDPYCLHVPKGVLPSLPFFQELTEEQIQRISETNKEREELYLKPDLQTIRTQESKVFDEYLKLILENTILPYNFDESNTYSISSICTHKREDFRFSESSSFFLESKSLLGNCLSTENNIFGKGTTVCMTLWDTLNSRHSSGTQASASLNKCLQVPFQNSLSPSWSTTNASSIRSMAQGHSQEVYFFGRKWGMGNANPEPSNSKSQKSAPKSKAIRIDTLKPTQVMNSEVQAGKHKSSIGTSPQSLRKQPPMAAPPSAPCPATMGAKSGDLVATISHIKIGPREPCPVHGLSPCGGPKCIVAASQQNQAPVKVTSAANPRRGVFELVVRRMVGAPLARNELMLEWTPPPCRAPPCGAPVTVACFPSGGCQPTKCRLVMCRPTPSKPKCCKKMCKKPCGLMPCGPIPCGTTPCGPSPCGPISCRVRCRKCRKPSCCGNPCSYVKVRHATPKRCPPPKCRPCPPAPCCGSPCSSGKACSSSPCLRPCPIGRRRPRKIRSYPRIKPHRKATSPCLNRSKECPVSRCSSYPGSCSGCLPCPPRKCCSVGPCQPKCCKSITCC